MLCYKIRKHLYILGSTVVQTRAGNKTDHPSSMIKFKIIKKQFGYAYKIKLKVPSPELSRRAGDQTTLSDDELMNSQYILGDAPLLRANDLEAKLDLRVDGLPRDVRPEMRIVVAPGGGRLAADAAGVRLVPRVHLEVVR